SNARGRKQAAMRGTATTSSGVPTRAAEIRRPPVRAASIWLLAALVALAACGRAAGTGTTTNPAREAGRQYAQCMRDNGVPDFPDPDASGQLRGAGHENQ